MPFIPHTDAEVREMLDAIGVEAIADLFDEIPSPLRCEALAAVPEALNEQQIVRLMTQRAASNLPHLCFAGAGAYEHHIPAAVWEIALRGEFYSSYTPYQAEASQGTLQVLYEYQSMLAGLMAMDVSNASLYDGASALAEAILMAIRANRHSRSKKILLPKSLHPTYRRVARTLVEGQQIELVEVDFEASSGQTPLEAVTRFTGQDIAALVVPQPNFFGRLEQVDALCDWAHQQHALVIAVVNPTAMALFKPPGQWGQQGADLACGEGQPLGIPLTSGGPYFGFLCCRQAFVHQLPGRLVGKTVDVEGKDGFTLTLQAREQHIRRGKATSNICTNQGLMVTAATLYLALLGPTGLRQVAAACHGNLKGLLARLNQIPGVSPHFNGPHFHEAVVRLPKPVEHVLDGLAQRGILGGADLGEDYPELGDALLICATETRSEDDLDTYAQALEDLLAC